MKKFLFVLLILILIFLSSCIFFQTINQPSKSLPNEVVSIPLHIKTNGGGDTPYFGVCIPTGWIIPGDSIECYGVYNNAIHILLVFKELFYYC